MIAGVAPPDELPENPFDDATVKEVTGADPEDAAVTSPLAFTVREAFVKLPTFEFTVANVAAAAPDADVVTSPVSDVSGAVPDEAAVIRPFAFTVKPP